MSRFEFNSVATTWVRLWPIFLASLVISLHATAQEASRYSATDFSELDNKGILQVWSEIKLTSKPRVIGSSVVGPCLSVQYDFEVLRFFGENPMPVKKTEAIVLDVIREDPNRPFWVEKLPVVRTRLKSAPAKGDNALVLLEIKSESPPKGSVSEDPFLPDASDGAARKPSTTAPHSTKLSFSYRVIRFRDDPEYAKFQAFCAVLNELKDGDIAVARSAALTLLVDPPKSTESEDAEVERSIARLRHLVFERDCSAAVEVAGGDQFPLNERINAMQFLVQYAKPKSWTEEMERIFLRLCDVYASQINDPAAPHPGPNHPGMILHTMYAEAAKGDLSTAIPTQLYQHEMDSYRRPANYRRLVAGAIAPDPNRPDFENRLKDCLTWLTKEPDGDVYGELLVAIEQIPRLTDAARALIEKTLPELPKPAAERLRARLDKQKK